MKELLKKITFLKNVIGMFYVSFYCVYVFINLSRNKGNDYLNTLLLVLAIIYLIIYFYSAFINANKKMKNTSKKVFNKSKKTIGFINAILVLTSVVVNDFNSFFSIIIAVITIGLYVFYMVIEIISLVIMNKIKKLARRIGWKNDTGN